MFFCFTFDDVRFLLLFLKGIFLYVSKTKHACTEKKSVLEFLFSMLLLPILIISPPSPTKIKLAAGKFIIEKVHVFLVVFFIIQWIFFRRINAHAQKDPHDCIVKVFFTLRIYKYLEAYIL